MFRESYSYCYVNFRFQKEEGLAPAVFVQSDCNPPSDRDTYIKELMKYIRIDAYGKCLNNKEMPQDINYELDLWKTKYFHFLAKYKFQIAFENAVCKDYITEKVFRPLSIGSVPVYFGSSTVRDFMPSDKAVIVVTDFKSPKDLAEYLHELNNNDDKYNEYLKHRKDGKISNVKFNIELKRRHNQGIMNKPRKGYPMTELLQGYSCFVCSQLHLRNNMLREHLNNPTHSLKPVKMGKSNHFDCPYPRTIFNNTDKSVRFDRFRKHIDEIKQHSVLLQKLLLENGTDSSKFPRI